MNLIPPRKICLSGGGIRAVAFVGALEVLQKENLLIHVNEYIGVSAGALIGFLLSVGYTLSELRRLVLEFDFGLIRNFWPEQTFEFFEQYGVDDGANLSKLLEVLLRQKNISTTTTFEELAERKLGLPRFRCYATDINACCPKEFSLEKTPTVPIATALRASMSLPFYFRPIEDPVTGHFLTDGVVMNNYPMVFLSEEDQRQSLGLMFSSEHMENAEIESLFDFMNQMLACVYLPKFRSIQMTLSERTIVLPKGEFPPWHFEATKEERQELIESAAMAVREFVKRGSREKPFRRYSVS